ncbi:MAG: SPOR domain-containing protein, partial [Gammaproteobacteria bacterium]|nr:SPOR domain-containing protein [Gammaproteobacteria bacterium]
FAAAAADFPPAAAALQSLPATGPSAAEALVLHDADWLLAQPAAAYTVQVAAGANAEVLLAMLRDAGLTGDVACVLEHPEARQAWSALVGVHAERAAAERALTTLPAALRANAPWVRRLSAVQKSLRSVEAARRAPAAAR